MMAAAMKHAVEAGRLAFLAGRIPRKRYASASSPLEGSSPEALRRRSVTWPRSASNRSLARLERERQRGRPAVQRRADGARSRARAGAPTLPHPPPPYDDSQLDARQPRRGTSCRRARRRSTDRSRAACARSSGAWSARRSRRSGSSTPRWSTISIATSPRTSESAEGDRERDRDAPRPCSSGDRLADAPDPVPADDHAATSTRGIGCTAAEAEVPTPGRARSAHDWLKRWESLAARDARCRRAPRVARRPAGDGGARAADGTHAEARSRTIARRFERSERTTESG